MYLMSLNILNTNDALGTDIVEDLISPLTIFSNKLH